MSQGATATPPQHAQASRGHLVRNVLIVVGVGLFVIVGLGIAGSIYAVHKAKEKVQELAQDTEASPARAAEVAAAIRGPQGTSGGDAAGQGDPGAASFPVWPSSVTSTGSFALPRAGMLVVTAIADPEGDYESMKQIQSINADGITLTVHAARSKDDSHANSEVTRLVLAKDLNTAHKYAELFGASQPRSLPGTTAITASKEVFAELSEKGSSPFSFQPDGVKGAIGNMVNLVAGFGGVSKKDLGGDDALAGITQDECDLTREGSGLFAFPVLLDDQPTTLPAVRAGCSTDDGPAEFYILNQPEYPLMLAWKLGSGSQLQVTKISYPSAPAKSATAAASSHIDQQLQENKKVEVYGIYFDFGSDRLKPESTPVLNEIAAVLAAHPDWKLNVSGHTDNIGSDESNLDLSKRRAAAVKASLIANHHIAPSRLETDGFGASRPVDTNATLAGRARNRRVELVRE
jgi:outer membrane protein OmpA-like peptidoglycan-associated protein